MREISFVEKNTHTHTKTREPNDSFSSPCGECEFGIDSQSSKRPGPAVATDAGGMDTDCGTENKYESPYVLRPTYLLQRSQHIMQVST